MLFHKFDFMLKNVRGKSMGIRNCWICGTPFFKKARDICPGCIETEIKMLGNIRDYLRRNPTGRLDEVAEGTGIDIKFINRFIREGRLDLKVKCKKCGIKIKNTHGRQYCDPCSELVRKGIMSTSERLSMEKKVKDDKIKELEQKRVNNTLRKSLYGLNASTKKPL